MREAPSMLKLYGPAHALGADARHQDAAELKRGRTLREAPGDPFLTHGVEPRPVLAACSIEDSVHQFPQR